MQNRISANLYVPFMYMQSFTFNWFHPLGADCLLQPALQQTNKQTTTDELPSPHTVVITFYLKFLNFSFKFSFNKKINDKKVTWRFDDLSKVKLPFYR